MKYYQSFTRGIYIEAGYMYLSYKCSLIYFARIIFSEQYHIEGKAYKDERYDEHVHYKQNISTKKKRTVIQYNVPLLHIFFISRLLLDKICCVNLIMIQVHFFDNMTYGYQ